MLAALPALLILKLGTVVAHQSGPMQRMEQQSLLAASAGPQAVVMRALTGAASAPSGQEGFHAPTPFLRPYAPEEWINAVAHGLNLPEGRMLDAARFVATMPVQVDVRARQVFVKVRLRSF